MVDHLRSGTNSYAQDTAPAGGAPDRRYKYAPARRMPDATIGETQIVPLVPPDGTPGAGTKGYGRFPSITEAMLIFYRSEAPGKSPELRVMFVVEPFTPTAGSWTWSPLVRYVVKGLDQVTLNSKSIGGSTAKNFFRKELINLVTARCGYGSGGAHNTAFTGTFASFRFWNTEEVIVKPGDGSNDFTKLIGPDGTPGDPERRYNFVSDPLPLVAGSELDLGRMNFAVGGEVTVEVHAG